MAQQFLTHCQDEKEKAKYEDLHRSINACDDVLKSVETNLASFQNDLATVSADIEFLQARSTALNQRLENRRSVEKVLSPLVDDLSVSPETITKIVKGHIDESWAKVLIDVDRRASVLRKKTSGSETTKASGELGPLLEKLILKVLMSLPQSRLTLKTPLGHRADTRLSRYPGQGAPFTEYQLPNHPAAQLPQV